VGAQGLLAPLAQAADAVAVDIVGADLYDHPGLA
jgi:hypothetical protein